MKKSDGMSPPTLVLSEEGQKGDFGPAPSSSMETGTISWIADAVRRQYRIAGSAASTAEAPAI